MLISVSAPPEKRPEIFALIEMFRGREETALPEPIARSMLGDCSDLVTYVGSVDDRLDFDLRRPRRDTSRRVARGRDRRRRYRDRPGNVRPARHCDGR